MYDTGPMIKSRDHYDWFTMTILHLGQPEIISGLNAASCCRVIGLLDMCG